MRMHRLRRVQAMWESDDRPLSFGRASWKGVDKEARGIVRFTRDQLRLVRRGDCRNGTAAVELSSEGSGRTGADCTSGPAKSDCAAQRWEWEGFGKLEDIYFARAPPTGKVGTLHPQICRDLCSSFVISLLAHSLHARDGGLFIAFAHFHWLVLSVAFSASGVMPSPRVPRSLLGFWGFV